MPSIIIGRRRENRLNSRARIGVCLTGNHESVEFGKVRYQEGHDDETSVSSNCSRPRPLGLVAHSRPVGGSLRRGIFAPGSGRRRGLTVKIGIVTFLTGPGGASPFGVPSRNAAEIVIEMLNAGKGTRALQHGLAWAAPRSKPNTWMRPARPRRWSPNIATSSSATRWTRRVGYISSGSCLAVTLVAEELQGADRLFRLRGTPRIFEEKARKYVFRPPPHATMDNVAAARYLLSKKKDIDSSSPASTRIMPGARIPGAISSAP